jgi:Fur family ferric uptake transcriptional regulator/Fur family peroxide stress response transcriptional regulator
MDTFEYLLRHDIKPSVQRLAIMNYLDAHRTHPTADEIFNDLSSSIPTLSKTTVYNTLRLFALQGVIQSITIDEKNEHFDADTSVHAHFLCKSCGKIYDAFIKSKRCPGEAELKEEGHKIDEVYIYYRGICKACKEKINNNNINK